MRERWERQLPGVPLVVVESPYRALVGPMVTYLDVLERAWPPDTETPTTIVVLPEYVARHWWDRLLYNQAAKRLKAALVGREHTVIADVPYRRSEVHLDEEPPEPGPRRSARASRDPVGIVTGATTRPGASRWPAVVAGLGGPHDRGRHVGIPIPTRGGRAVRWSDGPQDRLARGGQCPRQPWRAGGRPRRRDRLDASPRCRRRGPRRGRAARPRHRRGDGGGGAATSWRPSCSRPATWGRRSLTRRSSAGPT